MHIHQHILAPTDFSACANAALQHARSLATYYGTDLYVLHVVEEGSRWEDDLQDVLPTGQPGPRVHMIVRQSNDAAGAIMDVAREIGATMIVMGAHGDSGAERFLLCGLDHLLIGKTAEQVVTMSEIPVLTVGLRRGRNPQEVRRVLVPVNPDQPDVETVNYARELATLYRAQLDVLSVRESDDESTNGSEAQQLEMLKKILGTTGVPTQWHTRKGRLNRIIPGFAEQFDDQMIVLGTMGMQGAAPVAGSEEMAAFAVLTTRSTLFHN